MAFGVSSFTRKKILFLSLLIIFLGSISGPMYAEGLIHQDLQNGYSIEFPNNWYFDDTIVKFPADPGFDSGGTILGSFRDGVHWWNHFISVTLIYNDTISNYKGQQFLDKLTGELKNNCSVATFDVEGYQCSNYQIKSVDKINFAGKEAYQITQSWTETYPKNPQVDKISIVTDVVVGKNVWQIDSINLVDSYNKDYKLISDTINSFKFIDANGIASSQGFSIPQGIKNNTAMNNSNVVGNMLPKYLTSSGLNFSGASGSSKGSVNDNGKQSIQQSTTVSIPPQIPSWIKNTAQWWSKGQIGDSDFIKGIQYLIQNKIMKIPTITTNTSHSNQIPKWVKNNAGWWADGIISDSDFVLGIQYLVSEGIINMQNSSIADISSCDKLQTAADRETCTEKIQQENKLNNDVASAAPYVIGPITFYYINNTIEPTDNGRSILTIHFVVKNTGNSEITMSCQRHDSCNYALYDGQKEIPYSSNTLVYGSLTILPNTPKYVDWTFYEGLDYQPTKNYSFLVKEPWGSGSIPLKIQQ